MSDSDPAAGAELALLRTVVDGISTSLSYWDSSLHCRFANQAYARWFGTSSATLIGKHVGEVLGPGLEFDRPYIEGVLRGQPQEFEREFPASTTGDPTRQTLATYIPDAVDGVVRGFLVQIVDITERKRMELALRESEARFSGIMSIAADAIISVDEDRRITIFNDGAERIFGYAKAEIVGAQLDMLLPTRARAHHRLPLGAFSAGKTPPGPMGERSGTLVGVRKSGEEFPAEAAISKLEVGGRRLFTVVVRDITDRRRTEMEQEVFAEAGAVLASSLNYDQTLKAIAELVVSRLADLCAVDIVEEGEPVRRTVTSADPAKASVCERLAMLPLDRRRMLTWTAIETKRTQLLSIMTPQQVEAMAQSPAHLDVLADLAARSSVIAPMFAGDRVIGALVLASNTPGHFGERDVDFVTELARRAALALENARLYEASSERPRRVTRCSPSSPTMFGIHSPLSALPPRPSSTSMGHRAGRKTTIVSRSFCVP